MAPQEDFLTSLTARENASQLNRSSRCCEHPIFSADTLTKCPYNVDQSRLRDEVQGLRKWVATSTGITKGGAQCAFARMEKLEQVCKSQTSYISLLQSELHDRVADYYMYSDGSNTEAIFHAKKSLEYIKKFAREKLTASRDVKMHTMKSSQVKIAKIFLVKAELAAKNQGFQ